MLGQFLHRIFANNLDKYIQDILFKKYYIYGDASRVKIARTANVNNGLFNVASGDIIVEEYVFFGHNVCILTGIHDYTKFNLDRQKTIPLSGRDIIIKQGAWVASNSTVLGPCVIGEHSVITAGSIVTKDVPPYTIVGGIPARKIREIPHEDAKKGEGF
jgi:acetyltransferase-like isoleucine patch superfamily enzyme